MNQRRTFLLGASALAASAFMGVRANPAWPTKPVHIVVPFPAGGPTDFVVRLLSESLEKVIGYPVVIENRPGVSGNLGAQYVAESKPDGHTLVHNTVGVQGVNPLMFPNQKFNAQRDLAGVATTASIPNVLVLNHRKVDVSSMAELAEYARQAPYKLSIANFGSGTSAHIYGALYQQLGDFQALEVPYRGSALALTDVIGGQVDCVFSNMTTALSHIQAGTLRGLAITTSSRSPQLPDVPTMSEAGYPAFDLEFWFALFTSAQTPGPVLEVMRNAFAKAINDPAYIAALRARGAEPLITPPAELSKFLSTESEKWTNIAKKIGVKPTT
ncbi:tripartite tricarboxylate transporter substrate binding protein [Alcaligenaceae bacterium]|nr:tripartite tricarboxylate transporter substrate binding protein [Alcaligenaceae bacterium]